MSRKRPATHIDTIDEDNELPPLKKGKRPSTAAANDGMGDFEDEWEDDEDIDGDEEENAAEDDSDEDAMEVDVQEQEQDDPAETHAFIPGKHQLSKDEILEPDQSAYEMLHRMHVAWPCLSFDVLTDNLGERGGQFPATIYTVTGTQADQASKNEVLVLKMTSLHRTKRDDGDSDSEEEENEADLDEDAVLEYRSIPHLGGINRVRAQPYTRLSTTPYHIATWSETGDVHIFDIRSQIESLSNSTGLSGHGAKPVYTVKNHGRAEGFAMDWAASTSGLRLLTGDISSKIYLTTTTTSGFTTSPSPFTSHTSSIEDIQWSPSEPTVFSSCSADQSIRIWDVRVKGRKSALTVERAHDSDVNVISWNKATTATHLLVSGGDEGGIKVWDLRSLNKPNTTPSPVAQFTWHKSPITSIEWHPSEDSTFAASGADDQITLWDLSVEEDEEGAGTGEQNLKDVPAQLLFVHQGQRDIKELHWHPQIPGTIISTASDGFNVFKTISI